MYKGKLLICRQEFAFRTILEIQLKQKYGIILKWCVFRTKISIWLITEMISWFMCALYSAANSLKIKIFRFHLHKISSTSTYIIKPKSFVRNFLALAESAGDRVWLSIVVALRFGVFRIGRVCIDVGVFFRLFWMRFLFSCGSTTDEFVNCDTFMWFWRKKKLNSVH